MKKILCKRDFWYEDFKLFEKGSEYFHWSNFNGLNHFVSDKPYSTDNKNIMPFDGTTDFENRRSYLYDFFYTESEYRDIKLDIILDT